MERNFKYLIGEEHMELIKEILEQKIKNAETNSPSKDEESSGVWKEYDSTMKTTRVLRNNH